MTLARAAEGRALGSLARGASHASAVYSAPVSRPPLADPAPDSGSVPAPKMDEVLTRLRAYYGSPDPRRSDGPLAELVQTILSQNTSDVNTERAFASLWACFGDWEAILAAPTSAVADAIRVGGLANVKAPRIQAVLASIEQDRGELSLDFLADLPLDEARTYLTSLNGVGPKTAACVLLFALGMPALPVDTHVHRVSKRLGLIGPKVAAEPAHHLLESTIPAELMFDAHMLLIKHGRVICKALRPRCEACPLADVCPKVGIDG
jgi:endonuclease III